MTPLPRPVHDTEPCSACPEGPRPEEVHVLLLGLDPLAAALAVRLLRCGVLGLNVVDPAPVTSADLRAGAYRAADIGRPREASLRRRLRTLDARCVPVSAPELFPGALLPGTVVVRSIEHQPPGGPAPSGPAEPGPWERIDPRHPLVSLHRTDDALVRWPTVPWAHRPCPDCVQTTLGGRAPVAAPRGTAAVLASWAGPAHSEAVASRLAVEVLAVALDSLCPGCGPSGEDDGSGYARLYAPPWPEAAERLRIDRSRCLCGLGQE